MLFSISSLHHDANAKNIFKPKTGKELAKYLESDELRDRVDGLSVSLDDVSNSIVWNLNEVDPDLYCLAINNYYEAANRSLITKIMTSQVVYERVSDPRFKSTPCAVVKQAKYVDGEPLICQFSWFCSDKPKIIKLKNQDGTINKPKLNVWIDCIKAAIIARRGLVENLTGYSTHFYIPSLVKPAWSSHENYRTEVEFDGIAYVKWLNT